MPDFGRWNVGGGDPSLNEINRADRFFEALAAKQPVYSTDRDEADLAFLLSDWRDEVRDAPITAPVTPSDAVHALQAGSSRIRGGRRSFAIVGSVAAAMLCIGGFGTAVYGAGPGDSLYGMRTTIFGQQEVTRDDQVSLASAQLQQVQQLIDNGQWQEAQDKLVAVSTTVRDVGQVQQKLQLVDQWNALTYKVVEQDAAATLPPGQPLPVLPSSPLTWLPAPAVEATTSGSTTTSETTVTTPSDSSVPPEILLTPPSDGSTSSSTTTSTATSTATSPSASNSSTSPSAPPSATPPASTTTTVPPSSTPTTTPTTTTTATTTTTTVAPRPEATLQNSTSVVAPPVVRSAPAAPPPAPQPRLAPSAPVAPVPSSAPQATSAPATPSQPATSAAPPERPSAATTTTTVVPPS